MKRLLQLLTLTAGTVAGNMALADPFCTVTYEEPNNWGAGATHSVVVEYHGPDIEQWDLAWEFPGSETITQLWKGHYEQSGNQVGVIDRGYNGRVSSGDQIDFGFNLSNPSGTLPSEFYFNGRKCGAEAAPDDGGNPDPGMPDNGADEPAMPAGGWVLNNQDSSFSFITLKNSDIAERHTFHQLSGQVAEDGAAALAIDLATVDTGIDVRDGRVRDHLFHTELLPTLYFTTNLDPATVSSLEPGESRVMTLDGRLTLHGVSEDISAEVLVVRNSESVTSVSSYRPVMVNAGDFELVSGIETLRSLAGLSAIGRTVPVYFNLRFTTVEGTDGEPQPIQVGRAPDAPSIVGASHSAATGDVTISWQDLSDNETGFLIKRRRDNDHWQTLGRADANQTQWRDTTDSAGTYAYRVVAVNGSVPSTSSGTALINTQAPDDGGDNGDPDDGGDQGGDNAGGNEEPGDGSPDGGDSGMPGDDDGDNGDSPGVPGDDDGQDPDQGAGDDAINGAEIYAAQCASCHGADGDGGAVNVALTTPGDLEATSSYIRQAMPLGNAASCGANCSDAVSQYIADNFWDDSNVVLEEETPGPRQLNLLTRYHYQNAVEDLLAVDASNITDNFPVEARVKGFSNNAGKNRVSNRHAEEYLKAAERLAEAAVSQREQSLRNCDPASQGCAESFVADFGLRAFRRPLDNDERQAYLELFNAEATFADGMETVIQAMLVSPNFLYISELGEPDGDGSYELTPYEVASQLSFIFTGSIPDETLLAAAGAGELESPEQLAAQARRLLQTSKARVHMGHFAEQWLESDPASVGSKDPQLYPDFNNAVRDAMHRELRAFFTHVAFDSSQRFDELLTADYVFANQALADYYGIAGVSGDQIRKVTDTTGTRTGLLTLGAVMAAHGHANESAPIPRGNFVRRRLMCQDLPPPPEELDTSFPDPDPDFTTRERFAEKTGGPDCQTCHLYINGVGFGFEAFDGAGGYRTTDNGKPVNTYGEIHGLESLLENSSAAYDGAAGMQQVLTQTDSAKSCMATQFYRFSRGYIETDADANTLDNLTRLFADSDYNLQELMVGITQLQTFTLRREQ